MIMPSAVGKVECLIAGYLHRLLERQGKGFHQAFFFVITFAHIYREENQVVDMLSKKVFIESSGAIAYNQWVDVHEGSLFLLKLY